MSVHPSQEVVNPFRSNVLLRRRPKSFDRLPFLVYDVETYKAHFCVAYSLNDADGNEIKSGVVSEARDVFKLFKPVLAGEVRAVGFNNWNFDDRIMLYVLDFISRNARMPRAETIHQVGNLIIGGQNLSGEARQYRDEQLTQYGVPTFGNFSLAGMTDDVMLSMGTRTPSLKVLESRMGLESIEETPVPFDQPILSPEEIDGVEKYCLWDVLATRKIYLQVRDQIDSFGTMAQGLEQEIATLLSVEPSQVIQKLGTFQHPVKTRLTGVDWLGLYELRSLPQSQFAERYTRIQAFLAHLKITGEVDPFVVLPPDDKQVLAHPREETFVPDPHIPLAQDYQVRRWVREGLGTLKYVVHERGSRGGTPQMHIGVTKAQTADAIIIDGVLYRVGVGGIHSVDPAGVVEPGEGQELVDLDVTSFYPALMVNLKVAPYPWPEHLQTAFLENYQHLMEQRIALKGQIKKAEGEERRRVESLAYAYKIVLNSVYGKFRDRYSVLWSPKNHPRVTLHGQLFLLWAIERTVELGGKVVSANTDGFTIIAEPNVKPTLMAEAQAVGYTLEETQFTKIVRESISCYAALKPSGELKRKGAMETTLGLTAEVKRPIVYDAVVNFLLSGKPVETTVQEAVEAGDWARFAMMRKTTSKSPYFLVSNSDPEFKESGKVFRFLWAKRDWVHSSGRSGFRLTKESVKSSKFGDEWDIMPAREFSLEVDPDGIDISRYVAKAWEIIAKILPPTNQEKFLPTQPIGNVSPKQLWNMGIRPAANYGKMVLSGKQFSTIQPWGTATTMGCYTGPKNGRVVVLDVDDPDQFRRFLSYQKGKRKGSEVEFEVPEEITTHVSCKDGVDPNSVLDLQGRGKLVFSVPETDDYSGISVIETLPATAFHTKARAKVDGGAGFDLFWGQGGAHPSLSGLREDGSQYQFWVTGNEPPAPLPLWLWNKIEEHLSTADKQRITIKDVFLDEDSDEIVVEEEDSEAVAISRYGLDEAPVRDTVGIEFKEGVGEVVALSMRGSTWLTTLLQKGIENAGAKLFPLGKTSVKSHYSIPGFSPHVVEMECWGDHANSRGGKTVIAIVEDRETGEPRVIYKCFGSSCQSSHHEWRQAIQTEFDELLTARKVKVIERFRDQDEDLKGDGGSRLNPDPTPSTDPSGEAQSLPESSPEPEGLHRLLPGTKTIIGDLNPVAQWIMGEHVVGAFHQSTGSGKGYGSAQVAVENLLRGKLTLYVAPRNNQLYGFRTELIQALVRYRAQIQDRIGDIQDLVGCRFPALTHLSDTAFAQELCDRLTIIVNADNHAEKIKLTSQLIIMTNPYYLGQKGDTGKAHPFSYQLMDHAIRLEREGVIIMDEYHDIVREAWTKTMKVGVRYRMAYSQQYQGQIPRVLSNCPARPTGWSGKKTGSCEDCRFCASPATLKMDHGVLSWKNLNVVNVNSETEEHPFKEAENAPLMELGQTTPWVALTQGKTQSYASVQTMKVGNNPRWDDSWHEAPIAKGWEMNVGMWMEEPVKQLSEIDRMGAIYKRDKQALSYNLRASFGTRVVMDTPVVTSTGEPLLTQEALDEALEQYGAEGLTYPRNACQSPEIQWIDATAWYRMMVFISSGWNVRFMSATVSQEALDHVTILADRVAKVYTLTPEQEFNREDRKASGERQLEEVLVIGTGLTIQTAMSVLSRRRNTQLLSTATDESGRIVPNRIAAFFGRTVESQNFFERNASRSDFHPWWGLHQQNTIQIQHVIGQSTTDVAEALWMTGGERKTHEHVHIMSYLYGSLSTGANIENLRTLVVDYNTPPPLRSALTNYRDPSPEQLVIDHQKAFSNIMTQVCGRALRFRTHGNRAVILICGIDSKREFDELAQMIPFSDRAEQVRTRYFSDPNDLMPVMYKFLHRQSDIAQGIVEDLQHIVPKPLITEVELNPSFDTHEMDAPKILTFSTNSEEPDMVPNAIKISQLCAEVQPAIAQEESWDSFKSRFRLSKLPIEDREKVKSVWDEVFSVAISP